MDDDLGLSEREKELKRWNAPYVYREFPKMLFRGVSLVNGRVEYEQRIVSSVSEEADVLAAGWRHHPQEALDAEHARQAQLGVLAAERDWEDRRLSPAAQAEAAALDATTLRHQPEIPEQPKKRRKRRWAKRPAGLTVSGE
jgi:hypothetical protein